MINPENGIESIAQLQMLLQSHRELRHPKEMSGAQWLQQFRLELERPRMTGTRR
jgi:hypothetical protein